MAAHNGYPLANMNILLFHPRGYSHGPNILHSACVMPPLGLASIAAVLRQKGHTVSIIDAALYAHVTNQRWAKKICTLKPDFIGFSVTTSAFFDALDVCTSIKEINPSIKTVFGGAHASGNPKMLLQKYLAIDYIIAGEGEYSFCQLVDGVGPQTIPGLWYCKGHTIAQGPPHSKETLCELDNLPFPAYDLLPGFARKYRMPLFSYPHHPGANVVSSRGCVYQCSYCDRSVFGQSFRSNSPEYTFEQIAMLQKNFGVRHINFYDDLFTLNKQRVETLCKKMTTLLPAMSFNCIVRVGHIDKDLIGLLKKSGCFMVHVGIESGDQDVLDKFKDGLTVEAIRRDVESLHTAGLWVKGLFMMGFPGETEMSLQKTMDFALSLPLKDANITPFTPFPGAPVYATIREHGEFFEEWSKMDCVNVVFVPREIGTKKILDIHYKKFIRSFYQRPYMRPIYRKMLFQSPHSYLRLLQSAPAFLRYAFKTNS